MLGSAFQGAPVFPARYRFEAGYARIISGEDEGVYGWIAVNYLNGHLAPAAALPAPVVIQVRCPEERSQGQMMQHWALEGISTKRHAVHSVRVQGAASQFSTRSYLPCQAST